MSFMQIEARNAFRDKQGRSMPALCGSCTARHKGICGALDPDQLAALGKHSHRERAESGASLVNDAERMDRYAVLLSGVVKLTKTLSDGRQLIVGLQFAPDFLGRPFREEAKVNAEAATDVSFCSFPRAALERMIDASPGLARRLYRQSLDELDEAREWMVALGRKTASEKIASFLLMIARNIDPAATSAGVAVQFELPLTRTDIADFLGLTIETVSRQLTRMRAEKVISIENNRRVTIPDLDRLEARSGD